MYRKYRRRKYQKTLKSQKHKYNSREISKSQCSFCYNTIFHKAYENFLKSDKQSVETGQKIRYAKRQQNYDRKQHYNCPKVNNAICETPIIFSSEGNMKTSKAIVRMQKKNKFSKLLSF